MSPARDMLNNSTFAFIHLPQNLLSFIIYLHTGHSVSTLLILAACRRRVRYTSTRCPSSPCVSPQLSGYIRGPELYLGGHGFVFFVFFFFVVCLFVCLFSIFFIVPCSQHVKHFIIRNYSPGLKFTIIYLQHCYLIFGETLAIIPPG